MTPDRIDGKDVYEHIYLDEWEFTLHGFDEPTEFGDDSAYFHVTKATFEIDVFGQTIINLCPDELLRTLNDLNLEVYKKIIDQIKGA